VPRKIGTSSMRGGRSPPAASAAVGSSRPASWRAAASAASSRPYTRQAPAERRVTAGAGGMSSVASASSAAIFGSAFPASSDQPARSRMLVKPTAASGAAARAVSSNSGDSCVQATTSGRPAAKAARKLSSWARHSWLLTTSAPLPPQALARALPSSVIVASQLQTMTVLPSISIEFPLVVRAGARSHCCTQRRVGHNPFRPVGEPRPGGLGGNR
jgi:hypothetical protein